MRLFRFLLPFVCCFALLSAARAQDLVQQGAIQSTAVPPAPLRPDTVRIGIYVTSIHNIDFRQKEYTVTFWLWLKYKNKLFDFDQNLEVPLAKTVTRSFMTMDTTGGRVSMQMKLQCVMKDSWKIGSFPFDRQTLRLSIENSQFDARRMVFLPDAVGDHYDKRFALNGWNVDSFLVSNGIRKYETGFGDTTLSKPQTEYSSFKVRISIHREAAGLFWKMFLGMYLALLIAYMCFFIHPDSIDSRFSLSVGALFAVVGNKYIIDSSLPESSTFTLVDTLHGLTLAFICITIGATARSLNLVKEGKEAQARRFDRVLAHTMIAIYVLLNLWFIFWSVE